MVLVESFIRVDGVDFALGAIFGLMVAGLRPLNVINERVLKPFQQDLHVSKSD